MNNKTDTLLGLISDLIVRTNRTCIASAAVGVTISVTDSANVTIRDLVIDSSIRSMADCREDEPLSEHLRSTLAKHVRGDRVVATIRATVTSETVQACLAGAIDDFRIELSNIEEDVVIDGLTVQQTASAAVRKCLMSSQMKVGSLSLRDWLRQNESSFQLVNVSTSEPVHQRQVRAPIVSTPPLVAGSVMLALAIIFAAFAVVAVRR